MRIKLKKLAISLLSLTVGATLAVTPARANSATILTVDGVIISSATSSATPAIISVPADNSVDSPDAVKVLVTGLSQSTLVLVSGSGALIVNSISTEATPVPVSAGVSGATLNSGLSTAVEFYVYTTKSGLSSFTLTIGLSSITYYVLGKSGPAYNVSSNLAKTAYTSTIYYDGIEIKVTDVFGNPVSNAQVEYTAIGVAITSCNCVTDSTGTSTATVNYPKVAGQAAISLSVVATPVKGLVAPKNLDSNFISVIDVDVENSIALAASEKKLADAIELHASELAAAKAEGAKALTDAKELHASELAAAKAEGAKALTDAIALNASELAAAKAEGVGEVSRLNDLLQAEKASHEATKVALAAAEINSQSLAAAIATATQAKDAAEAANVQIEKLNSQVSTLLAALKSQLTTLGNTVAKIAKKVKA